MTKIKVNRETLDRWREALKSNNPHIQQLAADALRATAVSIEQEPVATMKMLHTYGHTTQPAAQPAQRKPLTDERILHFVDTHVGGSSPSHPLDNSDWIDFARAIEAAHGIKEGT